MAGPAGVRAAFALIVAATVAYHVVRLAVGLARRRRSGYDLDITHTAMGLAMVSMLVIPRIDGAGWALALAVPTAWFGWLAVRGYVIDGAGAISRHLPQVVSCAAMLYMLGAGAAVGLVSAVGASSVDAAGTGSMAGMSMPGPGTGSSAATTAFGLGSALTIAFVLAMIWVTTRTAIELRRSPAMTVGCRLAMGATSIYMLAAML